MLAPVLAASLALMCQGQLAPPTKAEQRQGAIESYAEDRAEFGFRSDIPYVEELIRRGVWEYDVGYIPVTPAENRYLRLRDRLTLGRRAARYLSRRRDLSGGISIEDAWPREPYLLVRLTRARAHHEANLRRLARFPDNLRTAQVRHSTRQLRRVARRVGDDWRELDRIGFELVGVGPDIVTNTAEVDLITARTDHAEYFARRYGDVVRTRVIATEPTKLECTTTDAYEIDSDGRGLVLHYGTGGGAKLEQVELTEHADRVEVGIVERVPNGARTLELRFEEAPVALRAPLGDRPVIDAATGLRLRQRGPGPGEPACPRPPRTRGRLAAMIDERRRLGLPDGRAHIRRQLRKGRFYTPAEQRYVDRRFELEADDRINAYVRRHRRELGGTEIRGRFPGRPYLLVRVTRRARFHERNLRRLARVRIVRADRSLAELEAVEREVGEARGFIGGWGDEGVLVAGVHIEGGRVVVRVVAARDDYAAVLRERFGPAVRAERVGRRHECAYTTFG